MIDRKIRIVYGEEDLSSALDVPVRLILEYGLKAGLFVSSSRSGKGKGAKEAKQP